MTPFFYHYVRSTILVRFLVGDDEKQANKVYTMFKKAEEQKSEFFVSILVMVELIWVLESVYDIERVDLIESLSQLILMPIFSFENLSAIQSFILEAQESNLDLSNLLIAHSANSFGCQTVLTFDKKASKHKIFELL